MTTPIIATVVPKPKRPRFWVGIGLSKHRHWTTGNPGLSQNEAIDNLRQITDGRDVEWLVYIPSTDEELTPERIEAAIAHVLASDEAEREETRGYGLTNEQAMRELVRRLGLLNQFPDAGKMVAAEETGQ